MKIVQICKDNSMNEIDLKFSSRNIISKLSKVSITQGGDSLKELYYWNYEKSKIICYSWYDGGDGFENKHDLPPGGISSFLDEDSSEQLLFGDIFLCKLQDNKFCDFDISNYGEFYNINFGGFEDCESSSENENDDNEEEDENYENDIEEEEDEECDYELINNSDNELEVDDYEY